MVVNTLSQVSGDVLFYFSFIRENFYSVNIRKFAKCRIAFSDDQHCRRMAERKSMNETLKVLESRRSCRKFKPDMVKKEELDAIIKAGTYAATGMGKQSPIIIAVTNKELRDALSEENRKIGGWSEGFDPFYGAPVVLIRFLSL